MKFLIFSDSEDSAKQVMTFLRGKGDFVLSSTERNESISKYGAQKVLLLEGKPDPKGIASILSDEFSNGGYDYILIASTVLGRDIASLFSGQKSLEVTPEIFDLKFNETTVITKRYGLGGKAVLEEESKSKVFTFLTGISEDVPGDGVSPKETRSIPEGAVKILEIEMKKEKEVNLEKANIIVAVGRGLGKKEGIQQIDPFVKAVKGEFAGSRPVCLDYHWLSEDRQVGYSGRTVKPKVYVALGISGQIQHIAGMRGSKVVVAVNKDKNAPIFQEADYGIVGDLYQVVPKIMSHL
jgi:electron transfer flavoprotein alpha subunit